jgi:uncharacterized membrane protein HdeD (DUF308 family)
MSTEVAAPSAAGSNEGWWIPLVMGILAILFGVLLLTNPAATSVWVAFVIGIWWMASGVMNLVSLFMDRTMWGLKLFSGILGLVAGFLVLESVGNNPLFTALGLATIYVFILGIQGIVIGVIDLVRAFQGGGWGIGIIGALSILFGIFLIMNPVIAGLTLPVVMGVLALVFGGMGVFAAFKLRKA